MKPKTPKEWLESLPSMLNKDAAENLDAAIVEAKRAINDLGALGVEIFTNIRGKPLAPAAEALR